MEINIDQIIIPPDRQRLEFDEAHVQRLMDSFKDVGQVQAILVSSPKYGANEDDKLKTFVTLIAGATRLEAARRLGWTKIRADVQDTETNLLQQQKAEYVENALRRDLPWQDQCLAISRIHNLMSNERALEGQRWTNTMLAHFTGYAETPIRYMLEVAKALKATPRDEEIWNAGGYSPAFQLILGRIDNEATAEIQRRQQQAALAAQAVAQQPEGDDEQDETIQEEDIAGQSLEARITEQQQPTKQTARIYGNVTPKADSFSLAIMYRPDKVTNPIDFVEVFHLLKPGGFFVCLGVALNAFALGSSAMKNGFQVMPYPLIWDTQQLIGAHIFPFEKNYVVGWVYIKPKINEEVETNNMFKYSPTTFSTITSFIHDDNQLPIAVVNHLTSILCVPGEPVLNPDCSALDALLKLGHTPYWEQQDDMWYEHYYNLCREYYKSQGIEVVV